MSIKCCGHTCEVPVGCWAGSERALAPVDHCGGGCMPAPVFTPDLRAWVEWDGGEHIGTGGRETVLLDDLRREREQSGDHAEWFV